ncbi:MAG: hypothetical protein HYW34_01930 [Candidatus Brennerbacteria bacterium]|nr:hypothetical protein [Candidatus Brennerbacteria bacterium]
MPTIKTRINISLSDNIKEKLARLARRDRIPQATKAARLLEIALEIEEEQVWDVIAGERDTKNARYLSHKKAWD